MMLSIKYLLYICFLVASVCAHSINVERSLSSSYPRNESTTRIVTYLKPASMGNNTSFSVKARSPGGNWTSLDAYLVNLSLINTTKGSSATQKSSMAYFDFSGTVGISVTYNAAPVTTAVIRPYSYGLIPQISGNNTVTFTLVKPRNVIVQVNDNIFDCLHLLTSTIETDIP